MKPLLLRMNKRLFVIRLIAIIISTVILLLLQPVGQPRRHVDALTVNNDSIPCNCVVFRMDDIQDYWIEQGQLIPMNLFISKNQSLSLGLIMHVVGNDSTIINKVREGNQKGLFELALHGWDHVDYSKLSEQRQQYSLQQANEKMKYLFGKTSKIFIPPDDAFDNETLEAMSRLGIRILSSVGYEEHKFNRNSSIFVADAKTYRHSPAIIYHIPGTTLFKDYVNGSWIKNPLDKVLDAVSVNVGKYGYAVIVIHPQDFVKIDGNGKFTNVLDESEIKDLSRLVDSVLSNHIHIVSLSKLI